MFSSCTTFTFTGAPLPVGVVSTNSTVNRTSIRNYLVKRRLNRIYDYGASYHPFLSQLDVLIADVGKKAKVVRECSRIVSHTFPYLVQEI